MVSNWFIVAPKIRRILSGERVVISNMLRNVNGYDSKAQPGTTPGEGIPPTSVYAGESRPAASDLLQETGPLPTDVETELYRVHDMISSMTDKW